MNAGRAGSFSGVNPTAGEKFFRLSPQSQIPKTATLTKDFSLLGGIMRSGTRAQIGIEAFGNSGSSVGSAGKEL